LTDGMDLTHREWLEKKIFLARICDSCVMLLARSLVHRHVVFELLILQVRFLSFFINC
jgi:hypothetical protein